MTSGDVKGGTFYKRIPAVLLADGYVYNAEAGKVESANATAMIVTGADRQYFNTLDKAVAAAVDGDTIVLVADTTENIVLEDKKINLDLGGKTLTGSIDAYAGEYSISNGTVKGTIYANGLAAGKTGKLTVAADATIDSGYALILWQAADKTGNGYTVDINGTLLGCVWVMGNITSGDSVINVRGTVNSAEDIGIALNGYATVNVFPGAYVEAKDSENVGTAIEVRAGTLNVTGGTIIGHGNPSTVEANGSGTMSTGCGIAVSRYDNSDISVNISGGDIKGCTALYVINTAATAEKKVEVSVSGGNFTATDGGNKAVDVHESEANVKGFISGGTFSGEIDEKYVDDAHHPVKNADGTYGVADGVILATVDGVDYTDFGEAVKAAAGEKIIVLQKDIEIYEMQTNDVLRINKNGGHNINLVIPEGYALVEPYTENTPSIHWFYKLVQLRSVIFMDGEKEIGRIDGLMPGTLLSAVYTANKDKWPTAPAKDGYNTIGWALDGKAISVQSGTTVIPDNGDLVLTVNRTPIDYTVTYQLNGGTMVNPFADPSEATAPAPEAGPFSKKAPYKSEIPTPTADPVLKDYDFQGWALQAKDENGEFLFKDEEKKIPTLEEELTPAPTTVPLNGMTLYAVWELHKYNVTFTGLGTEKLEPLTRTVGQAVAIPQPEAQEGMTFKGWKLKLDGVEQKDLVAPGAKIETASWTLAKREYTAVWAKNQAALMTSDGKTTQYETFAEATEKFNKTKNIAIILLDDDVLAVCELPELPVALNGHTGFELVGKDHPAATYYYKASEPVANANLKLDVTTYTKTACVAKVTYSNYQNMTTEAWEVVKNPDTLKEIVISYPTFAEAANAALTAAPAEGYDVVEALVTLINEDTAEEPYELKAGPLVVDQRYYNPKITAPRGQRLDNPNVGTVVTYSLVDVVYVTFDKADGTEPTEVTVDKGEAVAKPADPKRDGYIFQGWFEEGAEKAFDFTTKLEEDITLTAKWTPITYTFKFVAGEGEGEAMPDQVFTYGEAQVVSDNTYTKEGFHFVNWLVVGTNPAVYVQPGQSIETFTKMNGRVFTLVAQWEKNFYEVKFEDFGTDADGKEIVAPTFYVPFQETLNESAHIKNEDGEYVKPEGGFKVNPGPKANYHLIGWREKGTDNVCTPVSNVPITHNMIIVPEWEGNPVKITWNANGGKLADGMPATVKFGKAIPVPTAEQTPTKGKLGFAGWFQVTKNVKDEDVISETAFDFSTPVTTAEGITLNAMWEESVAEVDGKQYATFADAVKAAGVDGTKVITLWKAPAEDDFGTVTTNAVIKVKNGDPANLSLGSIKDKLIKVDVDAFKLTDEVGSGIVTYTVKKYVAKLTNGKNETTPYTELADKDEGEAKIKGAIDEYLENKSYYEFVKLYDSGEYTWAVPAEKVEEAKIVVKMMAEGLSLDITSSDVAYVVISKQEGDIVTYTFAKTVARVETKVYNVKPTAVQGKTEDELVEGSAATKYFATLEEAVNYAKAAKANDTEKSFVQADIILMADGSYILPVEDTLILKIEIGEATITTDNDQYVVFGDPDENDNTIITYKAYEKFTITYQFVDQNTEPIAEENVTQNNYNKGYGGKLTEIKFEREGFVIEGWYTDPDCKPANKFDLNTEMTETVKRFDPSILASTSKPAFVLYAKWTAKPYDIEYVLNGGEFAENAEVIRQFTAETLPVVIPNPTKEGYIFKGWNVTIEGTSVKDVFVSGDAEVAIKKGDILGNRTLVDVWEGKEVKLTFMNGSSIIDNTIVAHIGDKFVDVAPELAAVEGKVIADPDKYLDANDLWIDAPETIEADSATTYQLKWKNIYTITFKYGTLTLKTLTGHETGIKEGMTVPAAAAPAVTDENGNAPTKWLIEGTETVFEFDKTPVNSNLTLIPSWEPIDEPAEPDFSGIKFSRNLKLDESFDIMVTVKNLPAGTDPADYTIKVESEGKETVTIPLFSMTENKVDAAKCASGQLADVYHVTIAYKEDTILREFDYSVKQYCDTVIANPARYDSKVVNLCKAVLDYGTYAQKAFNYNTENLANGGNDYFDLSKIEIPETYKAVKTGAASGITKVSANLSLVSDITLNVYLYHADDADVKDYEITLDGKAYTPYDDGAKFVFTINNIPYALLDQVHTIEIVDSDEMALTFEISLIGYMYTSRNNAEFGNVYRAMYNYFTIAKEN